MAKLPFLATSLRQLTAITNVAYGEEIRSVAQAVWDKQLHPNNPLWEHLVAKAFSIESADGTAHVIAFTDERLPDLGIIGFFGATTLDAGVAVLKLAEHWLATQPGVTRVYGPINGTITYDYRLNDASDYKIPGEPVNPAWYLDVFRAAGYRDFNHYVSGQTRYFGLFIRLFVRTPRVPLASLKVRHFDASAKLDELRHYHELMNAIFPSQSIYCPVLSWEERRYNLGGLEPIFNSDYSYFLEDDGRPVGFIVAFPHDDQLVIKTIGVLPEYRGKRVSGLLIHRVHQQAKKDGLKIAVFSTVRVGNSIYRMRRLGVRTTRRYVTLSKLIG
ncbi:MAG: GCN5-related N-acetyltransferase [Patescibacteria group bacterium]|nr:GCN5-related N-acetyltransferase [Patescibacteria group bacterium]